MNIYLNYIKDIVLSIPFNVNIVTENNEYILSIDSLNIFSYGVDLNDTLNELKQDLNRLYDNLFLADYKLSGFALEHKEIIQKHI